MLKWFIVPVVVYGTLVALLYVAQACSNISKIAGERPTGDAPRPSDPEAALSCVQVFALGGRAGSTDASESAYFAVRGMLAKSVTEAARFVAERGVIEEGAPVVVRFVTQVASRFGVVLTQKFARKLFQSSVHSEVHQ